MKSNTLKRVVQETISLDGLIDRIISSNPQISDDELIRCVNMVLTYPSTDIAYIEERRRKIHTYQDQLSRLKNIPHIEQRTKEWYEMRNTMITASDFAAALGDGKFTSQKEFFKKKCGFEEHVFNPMIPPLKWGVMFEPIATSIYEQRYATKIQEFGILRHPTIPHFGASPDGINHLGIMLEIKCPFKRKITGDIPLQYYYQIQGQLDVCDLDECDYLECDFEEVYDRERFFAELDDVDTFEKGIILERMETDVDGNKMPKYVYSDVHHKNNRCDLQRWFDDAMIDAGNSEEIKPHFWMLNVFNVVRVYRDKEFIEDKFGDLEEIWDRLNAYKKDQNLYVQEIMTSSRGKNASASSVTRERAPKKTDNPFDTYLFDDAFLAT